MESGLKALLSVAFIAPVASSQSATWTKLRPTTSPPAMYIQAMAYDVARVRSVVYGGASGTWELFIGTWTQVKTNASPGPLFGHAMVYDHARQRVVLFGGATGTSNSNQTWEYDGSNWTRITTIGAPTGRPYMGMAYDSHRKRVVLFGGGIGTAVSDETWEYNGLTKTWTRITTATTPPKRYYFGMAYDEARRRTVIFGGSGRSFRLADTWEYDGTDWTNRTMANAPPSRWGHAMAYDTYREAVVLFGGTDIPKPTHYRDNWEWDGQRWLETTPTGSRPRARWGHTMAFDRIFDRMVVFGGQGLNPGYDTWFYQSGRFSARFDTFGQGCGPAPVCKLAAAYGSLPLLGKNFTMVASNLPTRATLALMTVGVRKTAGVSLAPYGLPGCFLYHSLDLILGFPVASGTGRFSVMIPNQGSVLGAKVYLQAASGRVVSNAGEIRAGDQ